MPVEWLRHLASDERLARHAGFWWGFAEGVFFFIVPDVYISFAILFSLRTGAVAWLASIVGSTVAIVAQYLLIVPLGLDYLAFLDWVPGISDRLIHRVAQSLTVDGLPYAPLLALGGVPLKVYGGVAFSLTWSLGSVLIWTVFARLVRIVPTFAGVAAMRLLFRHRIDARPANWCAMLGLFWLVFYVFYFNYMSRT